MIVMGIAVELELMSLQRTGLNRATELAMARGVLFGLPALLAPWIIYSSLRKSYDQIC